MTPFPVGTAVRVVSLGRAGEVVEAGRSGRYRVRVGGVVLSVGEDDLRPEAPSESGRKKASRVDEPARARATAEPVAAGARKALATLDLHGFTVEEALSAVEERLNAALLAGLEHVDIVHGRGSGRVKSAVHKFLKDVSAVRRFEVAPNNPGVTRVWL